MPSSHRSNKLGEAQEVCITDAPNIYHLRPKTSYSKERSDVAVSCRQILGPIPMLLFNDSEMGLRNLHFNMCFSWFQSCRPCHSEKSSVGVLRQDHIAIGRGGDFHEGDGGVLPQSSWAGLGRLSLDRWDGMLLPSAPHVLGSGFQRA